MKFGFKFEEDEESLTNLVWDTAPFPFFSQVNVYLLYHFADIKIICDAFEKQTKHMNASARSTLSFSSQCSLTMKTNVQVEGERRKKLNALHLTPWLCE